MGMTILGQRHVYEEEAGGGAAGGGGGGEQVAPADARKFVADFVHDPKALETMKDEDVVAYHGRLTQTIDKVRPKGTWPEKWREELAAGNAEVAKRFERYATPKDIANALIAAQNKISSGELKESKPFPENGADVEKVQWYKDNGLPATPAEYKLTLKDGLVVGKDDQPIIDGFLKSAHSKRYTPEQASAAVDWYYAEIDRQTAEQAKKDQDRATQTTDALNVEWGKEYRTNMNVLGGFLDQAPAGLKDKLLHGRLADGTPIGSSPEALRWLVGLARASNPAGIITPAGGGGMAASIDDEIKQIEGWMKAGRGSKEGAKYWDDVKAQERLRTLYGAREQAKGAGGK